MPDAEGEDYEKLINPNSRVSCDAKVEDSLSDATEADRYQFEREGYFCLDGMHSTAEKPVFNRIVALRDSWAKIENKTD